MNQFAKLRIQFTGLCSFVPHIDGNSACVVMVDGQRGTVPGTQPVAPLVGKGLEPNLRPHWSFLRFPLRTLAAGAHGNAEGVWYLRGHRITIAEIQSPQFHDFDLELDPGVPQMAGEALPADLGVLDPGCLKPQPSTNVGCHVVIDRGRWIPDKSKANLFTFDPAYPNHSVAGPKPHTHYVFTELEQVTSLTLLATPFGGGNPTPLTFAPTRPNDEATLTFANLCHVNPLEWNLRVGEPEKDVDFAWYYDLLSDGSPQDAKTKVKNKLEGLDRALPLPQLVGAPSFGGDNCNPNQFTATSFDLS